MTKQELLEVITDPTHSDGVKLASLELYNRANELQFDSIEQALAS